MEGVCRQDQHGGATEAGPGGCSWEQREGRVRRASPSRPPALGPQQHWPCSPKLPRPPPPASRTPWTNWQTFAPRPRLQVLGGLLFKARTPGSGKGTHSPNRAHVYESASWTGGRAGSRSLPRGQSHPLRLPTAPRHTPDVDEPGLHLEERLWALQDRDRARPRQVPTRPHAHTLPSSQTPHWALAQVGLPSPGLQFWVLGRVEEGWGEHYWGWGWDAGPCVGIRTTVGPQG